MKAVIKEIGKGRIQQTGEEFLDVAFDLVDNDGNVVMTRKLGFPLDATKETIVGELAKFVSAHESDKAHAERIAESEARHAAADETIAELTGQSVEVLAEKPE